MKTRIVKMLGFLVLNIVFFTILLGFAHQADKSTMHRVDQPGFRDSQQLIPVPQAENAAQHIQNSSQQLLVITAVAEININ